jgi:hypothetical protein
MVIVSMALEPALDPMYNPRLCKIAKGGGVEATRVGA